jgi:hypothetical protein
MKTRAFVFALAAIASTSVFSQTNTPNFDQRQANQERRIDQGLQSGQLTEREAARLDKGQDRLQRMEDKAKSDGTVTPQERKRLQHAENVQNRHISQQKHDRQRDLNHDGRKDRPARRK